MDLSCKKCIFLLTLPRESHTWKTQTTKLGHVSREGRGEGDSKLAIFASRTRGAGGRDSGTGRLFSEGRKKELPFLTLSLHHTSQNKQLCSTCFCLCGLSFGRQIEGVIYVSPTPLFPSTSWQSCPAAGFAAAFSAAKGVVTFHAVACLMGGNSQGTFKGNAKTSIQPSVHMFFLLSCNRFLPDCLAGALPDLCLTT